MVLFVIFQLIRVFVVKRADASKTKAIKEEIAPTQPAATRGTASRLLSQRLWGGRCGPQSPPKLLPRRERVGAPTPLGIHRQHRARLLALSHPYSTVRRSDHLVFMCCVCVRENRIEFSLKKK